MGDVLIAGLMVGDCSDRLCVRASRIWDFYDPQDGTNLLHTDLVLLDEEGNSVHAQIYPPVTERLNPLLKEGKVYNLSFVQVKQANRFYKAVENDVMINFTRWTTVEEVVQIPPAFPMITYSLTPMENLPSRVDNKEYFTDVIGVLTMVSDAIPLRPRIGQAETFKRNVTICDKNNGSLDVVLWGERATSFPAEQLLKDGQNTTQIVIFVGTLVRSYAGNISLTGGSSCKWYINPEVPEEKKLMSSLGNMHCPIALPQQSTYNAPKASDAEHQKVSEIKCLNPFKNKKIEWLVTVKVMKIDKSWWYASCKKCLRTTKPHGNTYKCANLSCNTIGAPNPRYKLVITAGDETGDAEFVMFGRVAQRLIKKTADALNPPGFIPDEITKLLEKSFTLNVSFTENTISSGNVSFQVNSIVAEINDGNPLPLTPASSQSSAIILPQGASSSVKSTPAKDSYLALTSSSTGSEATHASTTTPSMSVIRDARLPATPKSNKNIDSDKASVQASKSNLTSKVVPPANSPVVPDYSVLETQQSATKKRSRASPAKRATKKLFVDDDDKKDGEADCAEANAGPRSSEDDV